MDHYNIVRISLHVETRAAIYNRQTVQMKRVFHMLKMSGKDSDTLHSSHSNIWSSNQQPLLKYKASYTSTNALVPSTKYQQIRII